MRPVGRAALRSLRMEDEEKPAWVGAKKFSMKDRYTETVIDSENISKILPHRYPFLLVDRVVEFEAGKRAVGIKCITANEPQFTGHFPDRPIMPGVLMVEAMAQLGGMLCMEMELVNFDERLGFASMKGKAYVGGKVCVVVEEFTFALAK